MGNSVIPPLPPGFALDPDGGDGVPALPEGFTLDAAPKAPAPRETMNYRGLRMARQGPNVEVQPEPTDAEREALYDQTATVGTGAAMFGGGMLAAGPGILGSVARAALSPYTAGAYAGGKTLYNTGDPIKAAEAAVVAGVAQKGAGQVLGKLIKFIPKSVTEKFAGMFTGEAEAAKGAVTSAIKGGTLQSLGTKDVDAVLSKVVAGDVEGATAAMAKGLERSPKAAQEFAAAMEAEANRVAGSGPKMQPFRPIGNSPADVAARNAAKAAERATAPTPGPIVAPEAPRAVQMPVPGNVKPATVYTKPGPKVKPPAGESEAAKALAEKQKTVASPDAIRAAFETKPKGATPHSTKGPSGRPLTAAERMEALKELQRAVAADEDIFAAFGLEN